MSRPPLRLCLVTKTHVWVYEGRKQLMGFEHDGNPPRDLVEAMRVQVYTPMKEPA